MSKNKKKVNFTLFLVALCLFFLPWTEIQCGGNTIATQSGVQLIYGGGQASKELAELGKGTSQSKNEQPGPRSGLGTAYLVGIAFLCILLGLVKSATILFSKNVKQSFNTGILGAIALVSLIAQIALGFPVEKEIKKSNANADANINANTGKQMEAQMANEMQKMLIIKVEIKPVFYLELLILGVITFFTFIRGNRGNVAISANATPPNSPGDPKTL